MKMQTVKVPFVDLSLQWNQLKEELTQAFHLIGESSSFVLGKELDYFEQEFADFCGSSYGIGVASGTDGLHLAFRALDIGYGDEVIIPANTFAATALGVISSGAKPVLVDVNPNTLLLDPTQLADAVTTRTKAVCPVHLYGRCCDMDQIKEFADAYNLAIVEDASQAHGATWKGEKVGSIGDVGVFSLYPAKNLGALGDGGIIVTNNSLLNERLKRLRNYGSQEKYFHPEYGINSRLDSLQAAFLRIKLKRLPEWNKMRWEAAQMYNSLLKSIESLFIPELLPPSEHVFHLYVVCCEQRDLVREILAKRGIQTGIHYPRPFYLEPGFNHLGYKVGSFPNTEKLSQQILSLPIYPGITTDLIEVVCKNLQEAIIESLSQKHSDHLVREQ
ncbi:MAG: aminotransferase class I/II-fold pyridoxal phosphate-dependent enzyme [Cyanobacteria bacterium]|jgi:dTDP-4-amino-4,6-dideoxygalactose transaminase|nr:aminotransferase class I/II-fold pyridoxal phosphate-dependent enzyme [Cyanobacteria bacterium GSL.Bin21]